MHVVNAYFRQRRREKEIKEIVGLASACGSTLGGIVALIEQATRARDCTENWTKYLDDVIIQIKITIQILEKVVVQDKTDLQGPDVCSAITLINDGAEKLNSTIKSQTRSLGGNSIRVFLGEDFENAREVLYQAQTNLVVSLVANRVSDANVFNINIRIVDRIRKCFIECEGAIREPPILQLLKEKQSSVGDGSQLQLGEQSFGTLITEAQASNLTIGRDLSTQHSLPLPLQRSIYTYSPLPNGHIRVAQLYPGQSSDDIVVRLRHEPFQSHKVPIYEALSYVWGSKATMSRVQVAEATINGELCVTRNLDVALRHLRYTDRPRFLWVDAICIDQLNNVEKGPQVAMMGEIYRLAARVVVWLGPEQNHSDRAMSWLEYMGSQVDYGYSLTPLPGADESIADANVPAPLGAADTSYLYHLLCRPWFERLWVRQEIILANKDAVVLCGSCVVPWQLFRRGLACVYYKPQQFLQHSHPLSARAGVLRSLIAERPRGSPINEMRIIFGGLQCQEPVDRVYALLGLLHKTIDLDIRPNYTKSAAQVYDDLYTQYINKTSDLRFLAVCQLSDPPKGPSWQPKWSWDTSAARENSVLPLVFASGHFHASSPTPSAGKLRVTGVSVDRIQRVAENHVGDWVVFSDLAALIRDAFFFPPRLLSGDYISGGTLLEALTRAMFLDVFDENFSPVRKDFPELSASKELLGRLLEGADTTLFSREEDFALLTSANDALQGRCVFETDEGFVGLAPLNAKAGDEICVLAGSNVPMVLRHVAEDGYLVVGGCYTCGISNGEALLGPLPEEIRLINFWDNTRQVYRHTFINKKTGSRSLADPRLRNWPIDHEEYHKQVRRRSNPLSLDPEVFRSRGVHVRSFTLI